MPPDGAAWAGCDAVVGALLGALDEAAVVGALLDEAAVVGALLDELDEPDEAAGAAGDDELHASRIDPARTKAPIDTNRLRRVTG